MGFKEVKAKAIADLLSGDYAHEGRGDIDEKNLLQSGQIGAEDVVALLKMSRGGDHSSSPHHQDANLEVHVIKCRDWYVKFYFDPDTMFISVHKQEFGSGNK